MQDQRTILNRRNFLKVSATAAAVTAVAGRTETAAAADDGLDHRNERPDRMTYQKLGDRTKFNSSRLVFGCGAALAGGKAVRLLDQAYEAGINLYDIGSNAYYKGSENAFAEFRAAHKDDIFVVSKAPIRAGRPPKFGEDVSAEYAKEAAKQWADLLDQSLLDMKTDFIDAYYIMMVAHPGIVRLEEIYAEFERARDAGKVKYFGISTHQNAPECLEAAIETGWYDLAMIAVTPSGWYDGISQRLLTDKPPLKDLRPLLDRAREAGMGLVGMKAARAISVPNRAEETIRTFDSYYSDKAISSPLNPFQRAYAYVLENGLDVVNSDMQNFKHFEENLIAARTSADVFA